MKYQDRDELRSVIVGVGGVEQALYRGLLAPLDMPDDELRFQAKDLVLTAQESSYGRSWEEIPLNVSMQMFEHALAREECLRLNAGARWMMGEVPDV